jgi:phosphopantetheinyl transferase
VTSRAPSPLPSELEVAVADVPAGAAALLSGELHGPEVERLRTVRSTQRRDVLAASAVLRRQALSRVCSGPIRYVRTCPCGSTDHGRPRVAGSEGVEFSISHTLGYTAVAVSSSVVGLDVELEGRVRDEDARALCDAAEFTALREVGASPTEIWALKEATGKAIGFGLIGVEEVGLRSASLNNGVVSARSEDGTWFAQVVTTGGMAVAVATAHAHNGVTLRRATLFGTKFQFGAEHQMRGTLKTTPPGVARAGRVHRGQQPPGTAR